MKNAQPFLIKAVYRLVTLTCCSSIACSGNVAADGDASVQSETQPVIVGSDNLWKVSDFPLRVCFDPAGDGTTAQRQTARDDAEGTWGSIPGSAVSFTGWETCPSDTSDMDIQVLVDSNVTNDRSSSRIGTQLRASGARVTLSTVGTSGHLRYGNVHEFGHALGLVHEQVNSSNRCPDVSHAAGVTNFEVMSPYDHEGIMEYCSHYPQNPDPLERMFVQMVYPSSEAFQLGGRSMPLGCQGCFTRPSILDGQADTVVRADGVLQSAWTAAGMYPWWSDSTWTIDGRTASTDSGSITGATIGVDGSSAQHPLIFGGTMKWNGGTISSLSQVEVNTSKWTAIATTVL